MVVAVAANAVCEEWDSDLLPESLVSHFCVSLGFVRDNWNSGNKYKLDLCNVSNRSILSMNRSRSSKNILIL